MVNIANIPSTNKKRIIIVGGGFAGLTLAKNLSSEHFQIILIDKNNYHQFQPLLYQVAMAGIEAEDILFPFRKIFHHKKDFYFRMAELLSIDTENNEIHTTIGKISYNYIVIATGVTNNFFGKKGISENTLTMKSITEAITLRNKLLENFEKALEYNDPKKQEALLNVVIVGGGATGVELAGSLATMRIKMFPKDYPELDFNKMNIYLIEAGNRLLSNMSPKSSEKAKRFLEHQKVKILLNTQVTDYNGTTVLLDNTTIESVNVIWAAGVSGKKINGLDAQAYNASNRLIVNEFSIVKGYKNIYAIGDIAIMITPQYIKGHPQVAPVAIQQAKNIAKNFIRSQKNIPPKPFNYLNEGSLAAIGRNYAVADLPFLHISGFFAWLIWLFVHLMSIVGIKNRVFIFFNWAWSYFNYDQSLRIILKLKHK